MSEDRSNEHPPERALRLLIADDDRADVDLCLSYLKKAGVQFEAEWVFTREQFSERLLKQDVDVVLSDYRMGGWTGMDALAALKQHQPEVPLILMTGTLGDEVAVESIKAGVTDYVLKGQLARLPMALRRAQEERKLRAAEARAITERRALERQLANAQKFEAIGQLAGGIAHDFNNMIGAILGWADMGIEETEPGTRLHRHFEKVHQQGERAAALTRQLLAFARRQILEPRNMDLNHTVVETLNLLEKILGSNIEIRANLAPDLGIIRADPVQMGQVVMNLCINARDAMPNGGSLILESANAGFDEKFCAMQPLAHPGTYTMLSVTDSGIGMDAATLDRIFEPFFTTKEVGKGTGLGLATVYGIVRQHNGFIQVYSEPGIGSTFRVYLPVANAQAETRDAEERTQTVRGGCETLLVAEDHEGLRHLAIETLMGLGYEVITATNGEEALTQFERHRSRISLALLDVVMPKLSGPEVYERICASTPGFPVIFATGYSADSTLLKKAQTNGLPIVQKPYARRDLARKIRETLDSHVRTAIAAGAQTTSH